MSTSPPSSSVVPVPTGEAVERDVFQAWGLCKRYPGVAALEDVNFDIRAGEIHALMGQNGAGKSTLIKIITGATQADSGAMRLMGVPFQPHTPADARARGVCAVYQEVNLIPTLSIAENLALGRQPGWRFWINWRSMRRKARDAMKALNLPLDVDTPVGALPVAAQQMVAVVRAVQTRARVIIFDEPTSCLDARETERLFDVLRRLRDRGLGLVFITHFIEQVYRISDRITVLRNGRAVGTLDTPQLPRAELVGWMLGRSAAIPQAPQRSSPTSPTPLLQAKSIARRSLLEPLDLDIRPGEVVGLAGLLGSGRTEAAHLIFGVARRDQGTVAVGDRSIRPGSPRRAIAAGIALSPEDRKADGLFLDMSVRDNIAIAAQRKLGLGLGLVFRWRHRRLSRRLSQELGIIAPGLGRPVATLSGGNQQKVLLARWLAIKPRVLLLDEPTRGVDVGARAQIEALIEQLGRSGMAVLFISAEIGEVARRSHRVVILRDRKKVGELSGAAATEEAITKLIAG